MARTLTSKPGGAAGGYSAGGTDVAVADGGTGASTAADARTNLGLVIGTDVQAYDAELAAVAGLASAADKVPYFTGSGTAALADFSADGRTLVGNGSGATKRSTLGLAIGTDVQAYDADLAAIAGVTSAADKVPYFTGAGTAGVADFKALGRSIVGRAAATFSNDNATVGAGESVLMQTGTLSAWRTVTLPAANAVAAGADVLVMDSSGTAQASTRIRCVPAGGDTLVGCYPQICDPYGWVRFVSDGTSKWIAVASSNPHRIWLAGADTDLGTPEGDASAASTLTWTAALSSSAAMRRGGFVGAIGAAAGSAGRTQYWPLTGSTGPTLPASKRFSVRAVIGPRAGAGTYGANSSCHIILGFLGQDITHWVGLARYSATPTGYSYVSRDNSTTITETNPSAFLGQNTDFGAPVEVNVDYKEPVAATSDPEAYLETRGFAGNAHSSSQYDLDALMSGGAIDSSWQSGGNLEPFIAVEERGATAGSTFIADLEILKHPLDR